MIAVINIIRWLSLDIVAASVVLLFFVSRENGLAVPFPVALSLAISVWLIYTIDHLRDARRSNLSLDRHIFHKQYSKAITLGVYLATACGLLSLFWLPRSVLFWGHGLGIFCCLYLYLTDDLGRKGIKELVVAVAFAIGIFIYVLAVVPLSPGLFLDVIQLMLLAFTNLTLIALFEHPKDRESSFDSIATLLSSGEAYYLCVVTAVVGLVLSLIRLQEVQGSTLQLFYLLGSGSLLVVLLARNRFRKGEMYRLIGDGIFFIPLVL